MENFVASDHFHDRQRQEVYLYTNPLFPAYRKFGESLANRSSRQSGRAANDTGTVGLDGIAFCIVFLHTEMLRAGVKVYFYQPGILHSKTIIIDDELCSVGSTNFDFRSFEHNFEANAFIYDREVNSEMKRIFLEDQQQCRRIIQHYWRHRPLYQKGIESIMRLLSPVL